MSIRKILRIYPKLSEIAPSLATTIKVVIIAIAIALLLTIFSITYDILTNNFIATLKDILILILFLVIPYTIHTVVQNIYLTIISLKKLNIYQYPILRFEDFGTYIKKNVYSLASKLKEALNENDFVFSIINNTPNLGVIIINSDNTIIFFNKFIKELFNVKKDYTGSKINNLIFEKSFIDAISENTASKTITITLQGIEKSLEINTLNFNSRKVVFIKDVTNLTNLENTLSLITSIISHEVNTPLTNIQLGLERLETKVEIPRELEKTIFSNLNRLKVVISNITRLSNVITNKSIVTKRLFNLKKMVEEILETTNFNYENKDLKYSLEYLIDEEIYNDDDKFNLILTNIIDNAFKFSKNSSEVKVKVHYQEIESKKICIEISNEVEKEIPESELESIFNKFYRAQNSYSIRGKGLGLHISKLLCDMLEMEIKVTMEKTKITFTVTER